MKKKIGIYSITNTVTGRAYIGSSENIAFRWMRHRKELNKGVHPNRHLQRSWDKHGKVAFTFSILEECDLPILLDRENWWIAQTPLRYNVRIAAESNRGLRWKQKPEAVEKRRQYRHSPETLARLREIQNDPEMRARISAKTKGRRLSDEIRRKISAGRTGITWKMSKPRSEEHQRKIIAKLAKTYVVTPPEGDEFVVTNINDFCREMSLHANTMKAIARGVGQRHRGWRCRIAGCPEQDLLENGPRSARNKNHCRKIAESNAKTWVFVSPEGEMVTVVNLAAFCRERTLCKVQMRSVALGTRLHHKGWKSAEPGFTQRQRYAKLIRTWTVVSPDGEEMEIRNLLGFCRERGLNNASMVSVATGKRPHHKGWTCRRLEDPAAGLQRALAG